MRTKRSCAGLVALAAGGLWLAAAYGDERRFTYTYEPETPLRGTLEFEQWVTLGTQRTSDAEVKQGNYNLWEFREELEYGVTDNYSLSLYLNLANESYRDFSQDPAPYVSNFDFKGVSIENRYMLLNPADHAVGLTLYLEPRFSGSEIELEEKIILGQRYGEWKWAFNVSQATEWLDELSNLEGELVFSFGLARDLGKHWSVGVEFVNRNELPNYNLWENTAFFLGPVISYRRESWWAALTILPQIYGTNFNGNPGGNPHFELEGNERVNVRLLFGISF